MHKQSDAECTPIEKVEVNMHIKMKIDNDSQVIFNILNPSPLNVIVYNLNAMGYKVQLTYPEKNGDYSAWARAGHSTKGRCQVPEEEGQPAGEKSSHDNAESYHSFMLLMP